MPETESRICEDHELGNHEMRGPPVYNFFSHKPTNEITLDKDWTKSEQLDNILTTGQNPLRSDLLRSSKLD